MNIRNTITKLITITIAVAAIAVIGTIWMAGRAGADGRRDLNDIYVFRTPVGITPGQGFRVSVGSTEESDTNRFVYMYYTVSSPSGAPLYESGRIRVPQGGIGFSDVLREDLNTEGEPETGRVQVMMAVTIEAPAGSDPEDLTGSLEVFDERTGSTLVVVHVRSGNIASYPDPAS